MSRGVLNPKYRQRVGYQAALLGGMAMIASAALVVGDLQTREPIAQRHAENLQRSLDQVVPNEHYAGERMEDRVTVTDDAGATHTIHRGHAPDGSGVSAVAFEWRGQGYAGDIILLLGVDPDGTLLGVRTLRHSETPGLGDRIEVERDDWILAFTGRSLDDPPPDRWTVSGAGGDFDQFTGATITARAVVHAVRDGLTFFERHRAAILEPARTQEDDHGR